MILYAQARYKQGYAVFGMDCVPTYLTKLRYPVPSSLAEREPYLIRHSWYLLRYSRVTTAVR